MKVINDCYVIEFGDSIELVKYLLDAGCKVYVHLERHGHMFRLVYENQDYITTNLSLVLSSVKRGYRYNDKQLLNMIKSSMCLYL
jgi:hypothetical protein